MKCPTCKDVNLVMTDRQGVEIDYCPDCRGVWLDRGELDKIIERSATEQPSAARPQDRQSAHRTGRFSDGTQQKKKKGSFLSEFFEFD